MRVDTRVGPMLATQHQGARAGAVRRSVTEGARSGALQIEESEVVTREVPTFAPVITFHVDPSGVFLMQLGLVGTSLASESEVARMLRGSQPRPRTRVTNCGVSSLLLVFPPL